MSSYSVLEGGHSKYTCRVSSTLNRDTKQFGKKFLFDGREETCWNSDQVRLLCHALCSNPSCFILIIFY